MLYHHEPVPSPPSRVVVLGATGFVGKDLVRHLTESDIEAVPLASQEVDLSRPESAEKLLHAVRETDAIVIISALTPDKGKDIRTLMRNLMMGEHVSAFLERSKWSHVVYISSDAVYADDANPVRETSCCDPVSFHGLMHLVRERMLASAARKSGSPLLILRPSVLYGTNDTHNSYGPNRFLRTAQKEHKITLFGNGEEKRDHVYIKDVSRLTGLCLSHRSEGILNIATGKSISFYNVAEMISELCDSGVRIECLSRATPITHRHFDTAETLKAFPSFSYTPLRDGLSATLRSIAS